MAPPRRPQDHTARLTGALKTILNSGPASGDASAKPATTHHANVGSGQDAHRSHPLGARPSTWNADNRRGQSKRGISK